MAKYIITDLTRFADPDILCTAVIDMETGNCLRPMPYLKSQTIKELNIHPGAILDGEIALKQHVENPHLEDATYKNLKYAGPASGNEFKAILDQTLSDSVASGFGIPFAANQKHIPVGEHSKCSIITIKISPMALVIREDQFKPGRIKALFTDEAGHSYRYLSITDRGFFDYAKKHQNDGQLNEVQKFILTQKEVYLRIGVGRRFNIGDRDGYWLQVNGIYTFPSFHEEIRKY
ncbi:MAG: hypothetical protein GY748_06540 [Planctomycetaceae bacterium]|nr:hypothetical protein [Planctomycetaceae bacterium]